MKVWILNRKKIMIIMGCVITTLAGAFTFTSNIFKAEERKLPIYCVDRKDKVVSISFDAAWGNEQTQTLLDILSQKGVKSTFFLVGFYFAYSGYTLFEIQQISLKFLLNF